MGLQVRLAHSLGETLIDLEERGIDRPVVVGRSSTAEVQVPSPRVAKQHCFLFVRGGKWAVKDAGSASGTYLNGKPIRESALLRSGDVITLGTGNGAPSVTIDPHQLGPAMEVQQWEEPVAPKPTEPVQPPVEAQPRPSSLPPPVGGGRYSVPRSPAAGPIAYGAAPQYAAPAYAPPPPAAEDEWPAGDWADAPKESSYYVPKPKRVSPAVMVWTVVLSAGALAAVIWTVRNVQRRQRQEQGKPAVVIIEKDDPATRRVSPPATARSATQATGGSTEMKESDPPDPRRQEESWLAVERARFEDPVIAIVKFNDYFELQPETPFRKDVDQYIDEALDRLWWVRVVDLFGEVDEAKKEIAKRQDDLKLSKDEQFKKMLEEEIRQWTDKRDTADRRLRTEMKFTATDPPNLHDSGRLAHFRSQRPEEYFKKWKSEVYESIKRSRGQRLPWKETK